MAFNSRNSSETSVVTDQNGKPCRSCMDFRSWMKMQQASRKQENETIKNLQNVNGKTASLEESFKQFNVPTEDEYSGRRRVKSYSSDPPQPALAQDEEEEIVSSWGLGGKYGCPADIVALGRGSWRLLHSMAAYYPEKPSDEVKTDMKNFIQLFSKFYPCFPCAKDFREWIRENPPALTSKSTLSTWFCGAHNEVNRKLGKSEFDCNLVSQRWNEGWKDGSCD